MSEHVCPVCKGVQYVFTQRHQTLDEIVRRKYEVGELVYGLSRCPCCVLAGVEIGPPDASKDPSGIVAEGWCDFAERQARNGRVMRRAGAHPLAAA